MTIAILLHRSCLFFFFFLIYYFFKYGFGTVSYLPLLHPEQLYLVTGKGSPENSSKLGAMIASRNIWTLLLDAWSDFWVVVGGARSWTLILADPF